MFALHFNFFLQDFLLKVNSGMLFFFLSSFLVYFRLFQIKSIKNRLLLSFVDVFFSIFFALLFDESFLSSVFLFIYLPNIKKNRLCTEQSALIILYVFRFFVPSCTGFSLILLMILTSFEFFFFSFYGFDSPFALSLLLGFGRASFLNCRCEVMRVHQRVN